MATKKILIIEDEEDVQELLRYNLCREGFECEIAGDGDLGVAKALSISPDLILLDLMLPEIDGLEVCRKLRNNGQTDTVPIIMVTAKSDESDIVAGLELGADDYITKPFSPKVLVARVRAVLRRKKKEKAKQDEIIRIHGIEIDPGRHKVKIAGETVNLTSSEFSLLRFLASRPGWVFTRYQIVDAIHGNDYPVTDRSIDVQIVGLRKKMGDTGSCIETVRGIGYRFKEY
ncbi:MAG: response regulator transcription factor [Phycisphaerae bacterium]|nr:response regulator transcription factor [Phycisphaerae bacterium]